MLIVLTVHIVTVNFCIQAEELGNKARELKGLIDDSESVIFINLDRYSVCTFVFAFRFREIL